MAIIIAGHFQLQDEVEQARQALVEAGFDADRTSGFYVNQPGQHDLTPLGGDHVVSPGANESPAGVVEGAGTGGAIGVAVGAATAPLTGPLGPAVGGLLGAHLGSLFSFSKMKDPTEEGHHAARCAGMFVAVALDDPADETRAVEVLRRQGACHIERAQGNIVGGDWVDFDPNSEPNELD